MNPKFCAVTLFWDNGHIETFRTMALCIDETDSAICIEDGGVQKVFYKQYLRRVDVVEE